MSGQIEIFGVTDVGMQREHNEDNFVICQDLQLQEWQYRKGQTISLGQLGALLMVADGMGGTNAGEVASDIAQKTVKEIFSQLQELPQNISLFLKQAILQSHKAIVAHAKAHPECAGMGTTAVLAWLIGNQLYVAWSGDSRCYVLSSKQMQQIGHDHSMVWEMVKAGSISEEEAWDHPESNIITQSLGDPLNPPRPEVRVHNIRSNDRILVCSDGLNAMLKDQEISQMLQANTPTADTCRQLVEAANTAGGHDNITVLMLDVKSVPPLEPHQTNTGYATGDLTKSEMSRMLNTKNIWIGILAIALLALVGYELFNRFGSHTTPIETSKTDSLLIQHQTVMGVDSSQLQSSPAKDDSLSSTSTPSSKNQNTSQSTAKKGIIINPNTGQSKPSDIDEAPTTVDSSRSALPIDTAQLRKPSDLLPDSSKSNSNTPVLKIPTKQEFEEMFAEIIEIKAKALKKLNCMKGQVRKEDEVKVDALLQKSDAILTEMQQSVSFQGSKVSKLPQDEKRLALLNQQIGPWKNSYIAISQEADLILKDYEKKRFYEDCAGN